MNISHHIERAATFFPDKNAILFEGLQLTYRDLNAQGYGLTECSPFAGYNHDFRHKFGSVGAPVENTKSTAAATWPPTKPRRGWISYRNCPKARPARS
jgi:hypothetical protein